MAKDKPVEETSPAEPAPTPADAAAQQAAMEARSAVIAAMQTQALAATLQQSDAKLALMSKTVAVLITQVTNDMLLQMVEGKIVVNTDSLTTVRDLLFLTKDADAIGNAVTARLAPKT